MKAAGAGFLARQECRSHLDSLCAESQGGDYAPCISYASGGNLRGWAVRTDGILDLGDAWIKRARQ